MSYEESLRRSSQMGLSFGLSLNQKQQILRTQQMNQNSRRVSLSALSCFSPSSDSSRKSEVNQQQSVQSLSNTVLNQSSVESTLNNCENQSNCPNNQTISTGTGLSSGQNSGPNNSAIPVGSTPQPSSTMLPIISYDSVVMSRTNIEINRVNRRLSKSAQESFTCSQQSILSAMDRFVKSVNNMDSTVLVPSKLRDMDIPSLKLQRIPPALANTDLHSFYLMLNDVRKELLWGPNTGAVTSNSNLIPMSGRSSPRELKHIRQPSDDSLGSMGSTASSSSDQDTDSEADSMMTDRDSIDEHTSHLAAAFRHHLQGLHTILHQLADSADYLSSRYQEEIDASSL